MSFDAVAPPFNASDPYAKFLSSSCLDFLMIEVVSMARRVTSDLAPDGRRERARNNSASATDREKRHSGVKSSGDSAAAGIMGRSRGASSGKLEDDEEREAVFYKLETLGYRVGQGLAERFSRDRPRFTDTLDVIKFLCKDLWTVVFRKQIDNLKTNHRGIFVLTDNDFRPLSRMSTEAGSQAIPKAQPFLWLPCGIIRGALSSMGITAVVQAETADLRGATFQIKTAGAKP